VELNIHKQRTAVWRHCPEVLMMIMAASFRRSRGALSSSWLTLQLLPILLLCCSSAGSGDTSDSAAAEAYRRVHHRSLGQSGCVESPNASTAPAPAAVVINASFVHSSQQAWTITTRKGSETIRHYCFRISKQEQALSAQQKQACDSPCCTAYVDTAAVHVTLGSACIASAAAKVHARSTRWTVDGKGVKAQLVGDKLQLALKPSSAAERELCVSLTTGELDHWSWTNGRWPLSAPSPSAANRILHACCAATPSALMINHPPLLKAHLQSPYLPALGSPAAARKGPNPCSTIETLCGGSGQCILDIDTFAAVPNGSKKAKQVV